MCRQRRALDNVCTPRYIRGSTGRVLFCRMEGGKCLVLRERKLGIQFKDPSRPDRCLFVSSQCFCDFAAVCHISAWAPTLADVPRVAPSYLRAAVSASPAFQRSGSAPAQSWWTASASGHGRPAGTRGARERPRKNNRRRRINAGGKKIRFFLVLPSSPTWGPPPSLARPEPTQIWPAGREREGGRREETE